MSNAINSILNIWTIWPDSPKVLVKKRIQPKCTRNMLKMIWLDLFHIKYWVSFHLNNLDSVLCSQRYLWKCVLATLKTAFDPLRDTATFMSTKVAFKIPLQLLSSTDFACNILVAWLSMSFQAVRIREHLQTTRFATNDLMNIQFNCQIEIEHS